LHAAGVRRVEPMQESVLKQLELLRPQGHTPCRCEDWKSCVFLELWVGVKARPAAGGIVGQAAPFSVVAAAWHLTAQGHCIPAWHFMAQGYYIPAWHCMAQGYYILVS
jgi:hypothetical protein